MALQRAALRPTGGKKVLTIRIRVTATGIPAGAGVELTDLMLQPGTIVTGWMPHVTELPWVAGIVGGP